MKQSKSLLRHLRRERELSLDMLAFKTGINVSTLSRAERRLIGLTPHQSKALAKFFKVPAEQLLLDAPSGTVAA